MNEDESICHFISREGIMKICDIYNKNIDDTIRKINETNKNKIVVYIHIDQLNEFSKKIQFLEKNIILISGGGDWTLPYEVFENDKLFLEFIQNNKIIHHFAENCYIENEKITKIPIGLDYHTLYKNSHWWGEQKTPFEQEKELIDIKTNNIPFFKKKIKCYSNFHFADYGNKFGYSRKDIMNEIPSDLIYYEPEKVRRIESWKKQSEYAFVVSPFGNGMDCHRTWEALILGCIVIVKKSPLDILYQDLPVLIVENWNNITQELLEKTILDFKNKEFDYNKLTLEYWKTKFYICNSYDS